MRRIERGCRDEHRRTRRIRENIEWVREGEGEGGEGLDNVRRGVREKRQGQRQGREREGEVIGSVGRGRGGRAKETTETKTRKKEGEES